MEKCRACLVTGDVMQPIDDEFVYNYNILTNLDVKTSDNLYQFVCSTCLQAVKFFIDFREKCILSEASLRSNYENIKIEISADVNNIKAEYEENYQIDADESFIDPEDFDDDLKVNIKKECSEAPKKEPKIRKLKSNIKPAKKKRKYERKRPEDAESFHCDCRVSAQLHTTTNKTMTLACLGVCRCLIAFLDANTECDLFVDECKDVLSECLRFYERICSKEFKEKTALSEHVDSHKGTTTCFVCDEFFQEWPQLLAHRLVHLPVHKKQCHMCTRHFQKAQNLEFHYRKLHFGEKNFLMSCPNCDKKFENPTKLRKHVFSLHTDKKVCICDYCGKVASSKHSIRTHIYSHMDVKRFFCNSCDFSCKYHSGLKDHVVRHHEPGKIYCGNCKRPFKDQTDHDRHHCEIKAPKVCPICGLQLPGTYRRHVIRRHVPSRASCNDCRRPFKDQKALDEHKCNIKSSTICPICGVKVKGSCELNRHLESHKEVGHHKCPRCPKSYKSRGGLRAHIEWHDGAPSKKCEYCSMRFYHASSLTKHRRTHTGEKPYVCKICGRGFTGNNNLKVHMKIHGQDLIVKKNKLPETIF